MFFLCGTCMPPRKTPPRSTVSFCASSATTLEFSHAAMPRKSVTASMAARSDAYESEKVSTTSQPLPTVSQAERKSSTCGGRCTYGYKLDLGVYV